MNVRRQTVTAFVVLAAAQFVLMANGQNRTNDATVLRRDRRFIMFTSGGISKSVLGLSIPVETKDKVNWRTLNMGYNFQAQFVPVPSIIYPWTRFERSLERRKREFESSGRYWKDGTRQFMYGAYEVFMDRKGHNGKECLMRAICEAAQTPISHVSVFDEILQLFLTPNENEIHTDYVDAKIAGQHGVDCYTLYEKCPAGQGLLDGISYFTK